MHDNPQTVRRPCHERRLRLVRGLATLCYLVFVGSGMLALLTIALGSVGAHNSLGMEAIDVAMSFGQWPLFFQVFVPLGSVVCVVDLVLRSRHAYRYL